MPPDLPETIEQLDPTHVRWRGKRHVYFGGCDYLRLAWHAGIRRAVRDGVDRHGLNVSASRMTTGNHPIYGATETRLAEFFKARSVALVSSGYLSNLVVAQAYQGRAETVLIDESAHPSLRDAGCLMGAKLVSFRHLDTGDLRLKIAKAKGRVMVMTDAVFGHDGSLAPLRDYHAALPEKGILLADDSHGVGVLGDHGRGSLEHWGIAYRRVIQTATFSKAFGVYGGVILGGPGLRKRLASGSGAFIGNTPLPPHLVSGIAAAIGVMGRSQARRQRLLRNLRTVTAGIGVGQKNFPVISVVPANEAERRRIVRNLSAAGIHPPFIRYPGGVANGFFRFAISSEHTRGQLEALIGALQGL